MEQVTDTYLRSAIKLIEERELKEGYSMLHLALQESFATMDVERSLYLCNMLHELKHIMKKMEK